MQGEERNKRVKKNRCELVQRHLSWHPGRLQQNTAKAYSTKACPILERKMSHKEEKRRIEVCVNTVCTRKFKNNDSTGISCFLCFFTDQKITTS